jgi:hypothetical protein
MSSSDPDEAWNAFYLEYGPAMLAWQLVERELATLFWRLTGIPADMAFQIFYSGTSFNGRIDIFSAALTTSKAHEGAIALAHSIIGKAKSYSAYRNKFAHDQPLLHQWDQPAQFEIVMVHGKAQFQSDDVKQRHMDSAITVAQISDAAAAFRSFAKLIGDFWAHPMTRPARPALLDKLRVRLEALPILPHPKGQSQQRAKPKRLRPPSRG